jgi:cob(I)alamin adenosyltransferase
MLSLYRAGYNFSMSPLYNRSGDEGSTGLIGEGRLPKYAPRMETLGVLDEASAALGLARAMGKNPRTWDLLKEVQRDLYNIMTEVATIPENLQQFQGLDHQRVEWLESQIDAVTTEVPPPGGFILPGDSLPGAALALARTIVRRAERRVAGLLDGGEIKNKLLLQYLNRLSSLCFALELYENALAGKTTTLAKEK